jgi:hypothetical protein
MNLNFIWLIGIRFVLLRFQGARSEKYGYVQ